jgi:glutathione S-transferase
MAINLYLAKKYGKDLYPKNDAEEAKALQWSAWGISEIEPLQMRIVIQMLFTPEEKRDMKVVECARKGLHRPFKVLDATLRDRNWLIGEAFTVADLNGAAVMLLLSNIKVDYSEYENVQRWATACYARPALARARAKP